MMRSGPLELDNYINEVKQLLPGAPLLPELLNLLNKVDVDSERIVQLITYDPALTVNVLRACNSVTSASATPVGTVEEAVLRLGFGHVYRLVAAVSVAPMLRRAQDASHLKPPNLWEHSVTAAVAAQLVARDQGTDANVVFTAALLHDIGKVVLGEVLGQTYINLIREVEEHQVLPA